MSLVLLLLISIVCVFGQIDLSPMKSLWDQYVDGLVFEFGGDLQVNCTPKYFECIPSQEFPCNGVLIAWHGFTGCSDQFIEIAQIVQQRGFTVLLPLLPGHGLKYTTDSNGIQHDNFTFLPTTPTEYNDHLDRMNDIIQAAPSTYTKVAAGLSLGGAMAAGAALSVDLKGELIYNRAVCISPFFISRQGLLKDDLGEIISKIPGIGDIVSNFGQGCLDSRKIGRPGYCSFELKNILAGFEFAQIFYKQVTGWHLNHKKAAPTQFLYDVSDNTIDVSAVRKYAESLSTVDGQKGICSLDIHQHSMISTTDEVSLEKWWLKELDCKISSFILQEDIDYGKDLGKVNGLNFIDVSGVKDKWGGLECQFECTNETCTYSYPDPVQCPFARPEVK